MKMEKDEKKRKRFLPHMSLDDLITYRDALNEESNAIHHEIFERLREDGGWDKVKPNK